MTAGKLKMLWWPVWIVLCVLVFVLQLLVGSYPLSLNDIMHLSANTQASDIFFLSRLPAAIAATVGGAALALAGLQMQTYFKNPVAGPFVLGISSGSSLGVAVFIMLSGLMGYEWNNQWGVVLAAAVGAIAVFLLVVLISYRLSSAVSMLIIGLMIASFTGAMIEVIQTLATSESIKSYLFWTMGSFRNISLLQVPVMLFTTGVAMGISLMLIKPLNLLLIGEEYARLAGLNLKTTRFLVVISTCLLTAGVTSFCGPIGFLGLAVPHIARGIFKTSNHRILIPAVILIGAALSGMCNLLTGVSIHGLVLPVNAITSILGAPFVIWIVLRNAAIR